MCCQHGQGRRPGADRQAYAEQAPEQAQLLPPPATAELVEAMDATSHRRTASCWGRTADRHPGAGLTGGGHDHPQPLGRCRHHRRIAESRDSSQRTVPEQDEIGPVHQRFNSLISSFRRLCGRSPNRRHPAGTRRSFPHRNLITCQVQQQSDGQPLPRRQSASQTVADVQAHGQDRGSAGMARSSAQNGAAVVNRTIAEFSIAESFGNPKPP